MKDYMEEEFEDENGDDFKGLISIKAQFIKLANSDNLDKESALYMTRLQNCMETFYVRILQEKNKQIEQLNFELKAEHAKLEHQELMLRYTRCDHERQSLAEKHRTESERFHSQLEEHINTINRLNTEIGRRKK
jgi:hypothetical protein